MANGHRHVRKGQLQRRANIPKPVYLQEATDAANAVGQILVTRYGQFPWILQVMEMVRMGVDRGVKQLAGGPGPVQNSDAFVEAGPANPYTHQARTSPEDIAQINAQAAQQAHQPTVPAQLQPQAQQAQEAADAGRQDLFAQLAQVADPAQHLGQPIYGQPAPPPIQPSIQTESGLILPTGEAQPQGEPNASPDPGHPADPMSWLF